MCYFLFGVINTAKEYGILQKGSIVYENKSKRIMAATSKHLGCTAHLHKEIEMVYMLKGESKAYLDSEEYVIKEGDLFIAFPNRVHYYTTYTEENSILEIVPADFFVDYSNILVKNMPIVPVIHAKDLPDNIKNILLETVRLCASEEKYAHEMCKGYLTVFFGEVLPLFEYRKILGTNTDTLSSILAYCLQNYAESISLDAMAKELHTSKYYISRLFNEKIKMSFNDYINMLRVNEAKDQLAGSDLSVTEIGSLVGYNTIRSFNRAFLARVGVSPRDYRKACRSTE